MTVAELLDSVVNAGTAAAVGVMGFPVALGVAAYVTKAQRKLVLSQRIANVGIGVGFFALLVVACWTLYAASVPGMIGATNVLVFLAPVYLLGAGIGIERVLHPSEQEDIRARLRHVFLIVIVIGVLYYVLSRLDFHMLIWTNVWGFLFFFAALIGILYVLVRKVV